MGVVLEMRGDRDYLFNLITFLQLISSTCLVSEKSDSGHRIDPSILMPLGSDGCILRIRPQAAHKIHSKITAQYGALVPLGFV